MTFPPADPIDTIQSPQWAETLIKGAEHLGVTVSAQACRQLARHACELLVWNRRINLTTIIEPYAMAEKHYIDSLAAVAHIGQGASVLDIGAGGGFPGLPIHIVRPDTRVTLVDARARKVSFIKHAIRALELAGAEAIHGRAEALQNEGFLFDVVISRALMAPVDFIDLARGFCKPGGAVLVMQGRDDPDQTLSDEAGLRERADVRLPRVGTQTYNLPYSRARRGIVVVTL